MSSKAFLPLKSLINLPQGTRDDRDVTGVKNTSCSFTVQELILSTYMATVTTVCTPVLHRQSCRRKQHTCI